MIQEEEKKNGGGVGSIKNNSLQNKPMKVGKQLKSLFNHKEFRSVPMGPISCTHHSLGTGALLLPVFI